MKPLEIFNLLKETFVKWREDKASSHAAALSYYTTFSLAPLLVTVIAITALIWAREAVEAQVLAQVRDLIGEEGAQFIQDMLANAANPFTGTTVSVIGIVVLLIGAMGVFIELKNALNSIWEVELKPAENFIQNIKRIVFDRFLSFAMILVIGFLLLVSLVLSAGLASFQEYSQGLLGLPEIFMQFIHLVISLVVITILFALMFKFLPDAEIAWKDVWMGALVTAILFSIGKFALGVYLGRSEVASNFGAAASLALILVWIYYSAQILFFGAEFTQVYANKFGSKIIPKEDAVLVEEVKVPQETAGQTSQQAGLATATVGTYSSGIDSPELKPDDGEADQAPSEIFVSDEPDLENLDLTPQGAIVLSALFVGMLVISLFIGRRTLSRF